MLTVQGEVRYKRTLLKPADAESRKKLLEIENIKGVYPLDMYLGVCGYPFKMTVEMMLECAFWAQNQCSYQAAEDALLKALNIAVNDDTVRAVTNYIGSLVFEKDCQYVNEIFEKFNACNINSPHNKEGILYIETDGAALNTRHKNDDGSTWRENKLGVIFSSDNIYYWTSDKGERCHLITERDYVSYVGDVGEFKKHLYARAIKNGYGLYKETVIISDGAKWIANMAEELFPDAQRILDLFHLKENVYEYAKAKFNLDKKKYNPWAKRICDKLENGEWKEVLEELDPEEKYINCVNLHHYISENKDAINYPEYKAKGYFIGSGAIESGNKVVLQKRLKQAGMRWNPKTAQYLLTLKSKYESGRWQKEVVQYIIDYHKQLINR